MQAYSLLILTVSTVHSANIVEVLQQKGATTLVDLAVKAGLGETLTGTRILKTELNHMKFKKGINLVLHFEYQQQLLKTLFLVSIFLDRYPMSKF